MPPLRPSKRKAQLGPWNGFIRKTSTPIAMKTKPIVQYRPLKRKTDIAGALEFFNKVIKRKCVCFLLSDFICKDYDKNLRISNKKHDIIAVTITTLFQIHLPFNFNTHLYQG